MPPTTSADDTLVAAHLASGILAATMRVASVENPNPAISICSIYLYFRTRSQQPLGDSLIGGIATNFCCDTTAREAHAREFKVLFLSDGTATIDLRDTAGGTIPADQVQRLTLATLAFGFAEVLSVAEACEKLQSTRARATA